MNGDVVRYLLSQLLIVTILPSLWKLLTIYFLDLLSSDMVNIVLVIFSKCEVKFTKIVDTKGIILCLNM